jgi:hypothetical protein
MLAALFPADQEQEFSLDEAMAYLKRPTLRA